MNKNVKFKYCPRCDRQRKIASFGRNASRPDGLQGYCKECWASDQRIRYAIRKARQDGSIDLEYLVSSWPARRQP